MKITTTPFDGKSVIKVEGDLQISFVAAAKPDFLAVLDTEGDLLFDLSDVGECDTAGVQLLLMVLKSAKAKGNRRVTFSHSASFQAAADRIGIPAECFEYEKETR